MQQRQLLGARYNELCDAAGIARMAQRAERSSAFAQYTVRLPLGASREQVQARLKEAGIPTAVHYPLPLNQQPAYAGLCERPTPVAAQLAQQVMSLPMSADLSFQQQDAVLHALRAALA